MDYLQRAILEQGTVIDGNILKVDSFLNHQLDPQLMNHIGQDFARLFAGAHVTKVLTIETSGIAPALFVGLHLEVPVLFAKKTPSLTLTSNLYTAEVTSYTKRKQYRVVVDKNFLSTGDTVLLIDDFLAEGNALRGLAEIVAEAGAHVAGAGIVIEKGFQGGGDRLRQAGWRIESLAIVDSMTAGKIVFRNQRR